MKTEKENCENFDDGLTQVAPKGKFKAMKTESEVICKREVFDNIQRVREGRELTKPLKLLNQFCEFRKEWDNVYNLTHEKEIAKENEANKDKLKAYREANKDKIAKQKKAYYEANKDKIKAYREANKDKRNKREKMRDAWSKK